MFFKKSKKFSFFKWQNCLFLGQFLVHFSHLFSSYAKWRKEFLKKGKNAEILKKRERGKFLKEGKESENKIICSFLTEKLEDLKQMHFSILWGKA